MKELWKPIDWIENIPKDKYLISNMGNVYNTWTDKIVKQRFVNNQMVFAVYLYDEENNRLRNNILVTKTVVAKAFVPFPIKVDIAPEKHIHQLYIHHKDGDMKNNSAENLEWCMNNGLKSMAIESQVIMYELLLKYCNNRTPAELSDIVYNEIGVRFNNRSIYNICVKKHDKNSILGQYFHLVGTSIKEIADERDKLLRPIVLDALSGTWDESYANEKWVWSEYPGIQEQTYLVSTHGRIMNSSGEILKYHRNPTSRNLFVGLNTNTGRRKNISVARVIAYQFCDFPIGIEEHEFKNVIVKYKDGDADNLKCENLLWTTHQGSKKVGVDADTVRKIISYVKTLVDKGYAMTDICVLANSKFNVDYTIKKYQTMTDRTTDVYNATYNTLDVDCRKLRKRGTETRMRLTDDEVRFICEKLIEFNGNSRRTYEVVEEFIPDICMSAIQGIRNGTNYKKISTEYFQSGDFSKSAMHTPVEVYTLSGELLKKYGSILELSRDKYFIPVGMPYSTLVSRLDKSGGEYRINDFIIRKAGKTFRKSTAGNKHASKLVNIVHEVDESGNVMNVYHGYKDACNKLGLKYESQIRYRIINHKRLNNGHYLELFGEKIVSLDEFE